MPVKKLDKVYFNHRANSGAWCKLPYTGHPNGCPMYPKCIEDRNSDDFPPIRWEALDWYAVYTTFDLEAHAELMKDKHPEWTLAQRRNCLLWQGHVNAVLFNEAMQFSNKIGGSVILGRPEANAVNVILTMLKAGIRMETKYTNLKKVTKVMLVGAPKGNQPKTLKDAF